MINLPPSKLRAFHTPPFTFLVRGKYECTFSSPDQNPYATQFSSHLSGSIIRSFCKAANKAKEFARGERNLGRSVNFHGQRHLRYESGTSDKLEKDECSGLYEEQGEEMMCSIKIRPSDDTISWSVPRFKAVWSDFLVRYG